MNISKNIAFLVKTYLRIFLGLVFVKDIDGCSEGILTVVYGEARAGLRGTQGTGVPIRPQVAVSSGRGSRLTLGPSVLCGKGTNLVWLQPTFLRRIQLLGIY